MFKRLWLTARIDFENQLSMESVFCRGAWVAPSVKPQTLGLGSGDDLKVGEIEPQVRLCADYSKPAWHSLSVSLSPSFCPSPPKK